MIKADIDNGWRDWDTHHLHPLATPILMTAVVCLQPNHSDRLVYRESMDRVH